MGHLPWRRATDPENFITRIHTPTKYNLSHKHEPPANKSPSLQCYTVAMSDSQTHNRDKPWIQNLLSTALLVALMGVLLAEVNSLETSLRADVREIHNDLQNLGERVTRLEVLLSAGHTQPAVQLTEPPPPSDQS